MHENRKIRRGEIYMAELAEETICSVQAGTRTVLIAQSNWMNDRVIKYSESGKYYRESQRKFGKKCRSLNNRSKDM